LKTIVTNAFYLTLIGREIVDDIQEEASLNAKCTILGAAGFCSFSAFFLAFEYPIVQAMKRVSQCFNLIVGCVIPSILFLKIFHFRSLMWSIVSVCLILIGIAILTLEIFYLRALWK
jgi:hypothetical protein